MRNTANTKIRLGRDVVMHIIRLDGDARRSNTMTQTRTLIIRQAPRRFIVVEQNTETLECLVLPCLGQGCYWYTHLTMRSASRESWAKRYRTIKDALAEHPEAKRAPEHDPECDPEGSIL